MKKLILFIAILTANTVLHAQNALIKISPFHFADGTLHATYERTLSEQHSYLLSGGYRLAENGDEYGWMGELQARKYIVKPSINNSSQSPLAGIYGGLYANGKYFAQQSVTYNSGYEVEPYYTQNYDEDGNLTGSTYHQGSGYYYEEIKNRYHIKQAEAGVLMGFQVILSNNFSVDLFLGGGLRFSSVENKPKDVDFYYPERGYTGIVPKIGFDLGISL